jgi:hypothetical protein
MNTEPKTHMTVCNNENMEESLTRRSVKYEPTAWDDDTFITQTVSVQVSHLFIYLYYYIKHLRIRESIFCHDNFLLYPFYLSIRRIIFIFG